MILICKEVQEYSIVWKLDDSLKGSLLFQIKEIKDDFQRKEK